MLFDEKKNCQEDADEWRWAMLRSVNAEEAGRLAKKILKSETLRLERDIGMKTLPLNAAQAYRRHWALLIAGEEDRARAVLKDPADKGVPLP